MKTEEHDVEPISFIEFDKSLLGKVLTFYAQNNGHIEYSDIISVDNIDYNEDVEILTAFINITKETQH